MTNLILNSGFELYNDITKEPTNWICNIEGAPLPICPIADITQKHNGNSCLFIDIPGTIEQITGNVNQTIPVTPNTEYAFTSWFKVEGFGSNTVGVHPAINLIELDINFQPVIIDGKSVRYFSDTKSLVPAFPVTFDWTYVENLISASTYQSIGNKFTTSPGTHYIMIYFGAWRSYGKIWIDDLNLNNFIKDIAQYSTHNIILKATGQSPFTYKLFIDGFKYSEDIILESTHTLNLIFDMSAGLHTVRAEMVDSCALPQMVSVEQKINIITEPCPVPVCDIIIT